MNLAQSFGFSILLSLIFLVVDHAKASKASIASNTLHTTQFVADHLIPYFGNNILRTSSPTSSPFTRHLGYCRPSKQHEPCAQQRLHRLAIHPVPTRNSRQLSQTPVKSEQSNRPSHRYLCITSTFPAPHDRLIRSRTTCLRFQSVRIQTEFSANPAIRNPTQNPRERSVDQCHPSMHRRQP